MRKVILIAGGTTIVFLGVYGLAKRYQVNYLLKNIKNLRTLDELKDRLIDEFHSQFGEDIQVSEKLYNDIRSWSILVEEDLT